MDKLDDICRNIQQRYECGIKRITGKALIYVPIRQEPGFCLYSVVDVSFCRQQDYVIQKGKIKALLRRYGDTKTNIIKYPAISFGRNPTKRQKIEAEFIFYLGVYSYYNAFEIRVIEEKK